VKVAEELFVVEIRVIGDANAAKSLRRRPLRDQLKRILRIVRMLAVNVPVGFNDHNFVPPFGCYYHYSAKIPDFQALHRQ
jgi:hypothetical protein